ncbi:MAG: 50S ribosomal protein L5 [Candidatus Micrarchaeia archaeon]
MDDIYIDKVVVNIGIGQTEQQFQNAKMLIKLLTGREATQSKARKRDPSIGVKKGQVIGAMVTLRKKAAYDMLAKALDASNNIINERKINNNTLSFGIKEYIDFAGVKYDPKIGMLGMNIHAHFARKGLRVERRKRARSRCGEKHKTVEKQEIIDYLAKNFKTQTISE